MAESLDALERWMQAVVTDPGGPAAGATSSDARAALAAGIPDVFLPSQTLAAEARIGIYAEMYFLRLLEVLEDEFPALRALLGSESADALLRAYVVAHPSRHFSLNRLGARLPEFVRDGSGALPARAFAAEVARLERTLQDVFDAPEAAALGPDGLPALSPEGWSDARLVPVPALVLHAFEFPVNRWYQAFRDGAPRAAPRRKASWLAVYRRAGRIWRMDLSRAQHAVLEALSGGSTLGTALGRLAGIPGIGPAELGGVNSWFREWTAEGFFARVET